MRWERGEVGTPPSHRQEEHVGVELRRAAAQAACGRQAVSATTGARTANGGRAFTGVASTLHMVRQLPVNILLTPSVSWLH